jgi:hypothetical protein
MPLGTLMNTNNVAGAVWTRHVVYGIKVPKNNYRKNWRAISICSALINAGA